MSKRYEDIDQTCFFSVEIHGPVQPRRKPRKMVNLQGRTSAQQRRHEDKLQEARTSAVVRSIKAARMEAMIEHMAVDGTTGLDVSTDCPDMIEAVANAVSAYQPSGLAKSYRAKLAEAEPPRYCQNRMIVE